ncbi:hypothetical protein AZF37_04935 [endosymbiont 'TC1' of Trimyema compressum]|uniref:hypothetical protein n=1 Tax=endosymbiont 'TC1' of Trimyema compressum TaxID=243899 RepID=UPI0007F0B7F1|nr:hypothetical protein [endosymbiont 'TC1' of Trimyema compressum]AMP20604.1 hypothetical protein AZF37_04935 [endosymbiont 'TC1' of Trimyema compressum]
MVNDSLSLESKNIIITGASRPLGIGHSLTKRFLKYGANVAIHGYCPYDLALNYRDASNNNIFKLLDGRISKNKQ